jgi:hypothetical protein
MFAIGIAGCNEQGGRLVEKEPSKATPVPTQPQITMESPHGEGGSPAMGGMGVQPPAVDQNVEIKDSTVTIGNLRFTIDPAWESQEPSSSMRAAQFVLPGEGDAGAGEMAIYRGIGGSSKANIQRWVAQMQQPDGIDPEDAEIRTRQIGDFEAMTLDVTGKYAVSAMMGGGQTIENARMLAAAVEGPGGPYHFKAVGPEETMDAWAAAFEEMVQSFENVE